MLDDCCLLLTSVAGYPDAFTDICCIHNIDVSAHKNYLIEFLKNFCEELCLARSANYTHDFDSVNTKNTNIKNYFWWLSQPRRWLPEARLWNVDSRRSIDQKDCADYAFFREFFRKLILSKTWRHNRKNPLDQSPTTASFASDSRSRPDLL